MTKKLLLLFLFVSTLLVSRATAAANDDAPPRPNVIIFFIDDMGYADIEPFGAEFNKTPNLNKLAKKGLKFNNFYVASVACSPSRTALLTGCYAWRLGMGGGVAFPHLDKALNPNEYTMAEMFRDAGYHTGCFGKWHLGHLKGYLPPSHGFDVYAGIPYSNDMWSGSNNKKRNYPPLPWIVGNKPVAKVTTGSDQSYLTKATTDAALAFIGKAGKDAAKKGDARKPFFCYLPYAAVHNPKHPREPFWSNVLKRRAKQEKDASGNGGMDWGTTAKMHVAAQIEELDTDVGRVVSLLEKLNIDKNTLILWLSDNGGTGGTQMMPLRGRKTGAARYEGNFRTPLLACWPSKIPPGTVTDALGSTIDLLPTFAHLAGGKLSKNAIDGVDLTSVLYDPTDAKGPRTYIRSGAGAFRKGDWKIVGHAKSPAELYNLADDVGETKDLAKERPELLKKLLAERDAITAKEEALGIRERAAMPNVRPLLPVADQDKVPSLVDYLGVE